MKTEARFKRQFDPTYNGTRHYSKFPKSETVPDLNLTVRQLMERHTRGISMQEQPREEHYFEDEPLPVIRDLNDIADYKEENKARKEALENKLKQEREKRAKQQAEQAEKARQQASQQSTAQAAQKEGNATTEPAKEGS